MLVGKSRNIENIKKGICPYCKRNLKPYVDIDEEEHWTIMKFSKKSELLSERNEVKQGIDYLVCRYCDFKIKKSDIRNEHFPKKLDERYTKKQKQKIKKCIHIPVPKECPYCQGKKIREYPEDYTWECLNPDCEVVFEWKEYEVHFYGTIRVVADSEEMASELAYQRTGDLWNEINEI
ncbi:MAG: hypothetical protein BAJALOKI1v1_2560009 [Promethearchaeota archaeon]|nr:MAG: hypothetical protein BAJALOKI1v1_2560009 [Candidatus Lokiarchaeota archaeon]